MPTIESFIKQPEEEAKRCFYNKWLYKLDSLDARHFKSYENGDNDFAICFNDSSYERAVVIRYDHFWFTGVSMTRK